MPKQNLETRSRLQLTIRPEEKAAIVRAAKLEHMDLTHFVLRTVLPAAQAVIERSEKVELTERDSLRVFDLLEHPPLPNQRLLAAAQALPTDP